MFMVKSFPSIQQFSEYYKLCDLEKQLSLTPLRYFQILIKGIKDDCQVPPNNEESKWSARSERAGNLEKERVKHLAHGYT